MTAVLVYRTYEREDIPQILDLWKNHSDFGEIDEATFNLWFLKTPYENCEIVVAENEENKIIGQIIFMPSRLILNGKEIKSLRVAAPIIHNDFKLTIADLFNNPLWGMYMYGMQIAVKKEFSLAYFFPARGWLKAIEMVKTENDRWELSSFKTFSIPIERIQNLNPHLNLLYDFRVCHTFSDEYDTLWETAVRTLPIHCGIIRRKAWLRYRLSDHLTIECRSKSANQLVGYVTIKKSNGLVIDILATTNEEISIVLGGTIQFLSLSENKSDFPNQYITGMYTPHMEKTLSNFPFEFASYEFAFGCYVIDKSIAHKDIISSKWYLMPDV